jgi:hypothetical protein
MPISHFICILCKFIIYNLAVVFMQKQVVFLHLNYRYKPIYVFKKRIKPFYRDGFWRLNQINVNEQGHCIGQIYLPIKCK